VSRRAERETAGGRAAGIGARRGSGKRAERPVESGDAAALSREKKGERGAASSNRERTRRCILDPRRIGLIR